MRLSKALILVLLICTPAMAGRLHPERWYQNRWCGEHGGAVEVVMPDRTRVDCVTGSHAVEFDFASKWAEAIGQALLYGAHTGKRPGIALIVEDDKDWKYVERLNRVIEAYGLPIDVWVVRP